MTVHAEHMHTETGLWCHRCLLPSGVRMDFVLTIGDSRPMLASRAVCQDCGKTVR